MGWITMSERDLQRVEVLGDVLSGRRGGGSAASVLGLSERQVWRLLARYKAGGGGALVHRGRTRYDMATLKSAMRRAGRAERRFPGASPSIRPWENTTARFG